MDDPIGEAWAGDRDFADLTPEQKFESRRRHLNLALRGYHEREDEVAITHVEKRLSELFNEEEEYKRQRREEEAADLREQRDADERLSNQPLKQRAANLQTELQTIKRSIPHSPSLAEQRLSQQINHFSRSLTDFIDNPFTI